MAARNASAEGWRQQESTEDVSSKIRTIAIGLAVAASEPRVMGDRPFEVKNVNASDALALIATPCNRREDGTRIAENDSRTVGEFMRCVQYEYAEAKENNSPADFYGSLLLMAFGLGSVGFSVKKMFEPQ